MRINYTNRIFGLDIVRAIAILLILISHTSLLIAPANTGLFTTAIKLGGAIGVDIFFVLSGYLIGGILLRNIIQGKGGFGHFLYFWIRRWFRTLPNYYLILLVNILLGIFVFSDLAEDYLSYFFFLQNFNGPQSNFFTESWSLSIEEFSYVLGPLLLFFLLNAFGLRRGKSCFLFTTAVVIVLFIGSKFWYHFNIQNVDYSFWSANVRKTVIYRLDSIYYGFLGAYAISFIPFVKKYASLLFAAGIGLLIGIHGFMFFKSFTVTSHPMFYNVFYLPSISVAVLLMMFKMNAVTKAPMPIVRTVTFVSLTSYSIYLLNYSIVLLLLQKYLATPETLLGKMMLIIVFWSLTISFSYILYAFYEKPMMKLRDHHFFVGLFK
ncbi:acyltransferase family protein [Sungkyunkwania multivorans]|uniref:Acyltransferase family protein n=1 Tax=Sungkyunkwania multivorans TaxID=1173618 RepID=A0ABW3CX69_9FLAO